jgi:hypothetical protein
VGEPPEAETGFRPTSDDEQKGSTSMGVDGTWSMEIASDDIDPEIVPTEATLTITSEGSALKGSMEGPYPMGEGVTITNGTLEGETVKWTAAMRGERLRPQVLEFSGTVAGKEMSGEVEVGIFGTASFRAKQTS